VKKRRLTSIGSVASKPEQLKSTYAQLINMHLQRNGEPPVEGSREALIASAEFHENDTKYTVVALTFGFSALALITAGAGFNDSDVMFALLIILLVALFSVAALLVVLVSRWQASPRKAAVAILDYRDAQRNLPRPHNPKKRAWRSLATPTTPLSSRKLRRNSNISKH